MGGVEGIELHVACDAASTADARDQGERSQIDFRIDEGTGERVYRGADAAPRTPDVRHSIGAQERLDRVRGGIISIDIDQTV